MKTVPVTSTNIAGIGYDPARKELRVEFRNGAVHDHVDVDPEIHSRFMSAESHGKFYHANIKGKSESRKMTDTPAANPKPAAESSDLPPGLETAIRRYRQEDQ